MISILSWRRRTSEAEDGFALVLSLLMILIVAALSLAMAAVILNQQQPTQEARKALVTINAAQTGLQAALTRLRAANDLTDASAGNITALPCNEDDPNAATYSTERTGRTRTFTMSGASFSGRVTGATAGVAAASYRVSVSYFLTVDPGTLNPTTLPNFDMACPLTKVPKFAYLQSFGIGSPIPNDATAASDRSQTGTYTFSTNNTNTAGGRLRSFGTQLCLDAGKAPAAGTTMTMQPCLAFGTPQQTWQYRKDLSIAYGGDTSLHLCIRSPLTATSTSAVLTRCTTDNGDGETYAYAAGQQVQEWGFNDNGHFSGALDDGTVTNGDGGHCLQPSTTSTANALLAWVSCSGDTSGPQAFDPDPEVGAGKAGGDILGVPGATKQFVNYAQFGRCLDITGQNVNADHLIAYPCKQAPDSSKLTFNQVWTYSGSNTTAGSFYVNYGVRYCLTAPSSGKLATTTPCIAGVLPPNQSWKATGKIDGDYASSYTLRSSVNNYCLGVSPLSEALTNASSNITVTACDGSASQKWNAPPVEPDSRLGDILETGGG